MKINIDEFIDIQSQQKIWALILPYFLQDCQIRAVKNLGPEQDPHFLKISDQFGPVGPRT